VARAKRKDILIEAQGLAKVYGRPFSPLGIMQRAADGLVAALGGRGPGNVFAVEDLSFSVSAGGIVGFLGPNGAGKTTTLKMLLGFLRPTRGVGLLFGQDPRCDHAAIFSRVGGLVDKPHFYDYLSARENLELFGSLHKSITVARIEEVLERVGVAWAADRRVGTYSTGMLQRLGLAAAILHEPELLILDEPTRGLDPKGQAEVRSLLQEVGGSGRTTILLSSHLLFEVEQVCSRVIIIDKGRMLFNGSVEDLASQQSEQLRVVVDDVARAAKLVAKIDGVVSVDEVEQGGGKALLIATKTNSAPAIAKVLVDAGIALEQLVPVRPSLEEEFLRVVARGQEGEEVT